MDMFEANAAFYNNPIRLNEQEKKKPDEVVKHFFSSYNLYEIRRALWNLTEIALTTPNAIFDDAEEREYILYFYQQLETFIEAAYLMDQHR